MSRKPFVHSCRAVKRKTDTAHNSTSCSCRKHIVSGLHAVTSLEVHSALAWVAKGAPFIMVSLEQELKDARSFALPVVAECVRVLMVVLVVLDQSAKGVKSAQVAVLALATGWHICMRAGGAWSLIRVVLANSAIVCKAASFRRHRVCRHHLHI